MASQVSSVNFSTYRNSGRDSACSIFSLFRPFRMRNSPSLKQQYIFSHAYAYRGCCSTGIILFSPPLCYRPYSTICSVLLAMVPIHALYYSLLRALNHRPREICKLAGKWLALCCFKRPSRNSFWTRRTQDRNFSFEGLGGRGGGGGPSLLSLL